MGLQQLRQIHVLAVQLDGGQVLAEEAVAEAQLGALLAGLFADQAGFHQGQQLALQLGGFAALGPGDQGQGAGRG